MNLMTAVLAVVLVRDEAALREAFAKEIQAKEAPQRVAALKKLSGAAEEKTIELLAAGLKDVDLEVRKAAAETLEASTDGAGLANKSLGEILMDKKEDLALRMACAKAMSKSRYKGEVFYCYFKTISSIEPEERQFHKFGFQVTQILDKYVSKSFGADRATAERWEEWWTDNKAALLKEDEKKHEEWKKEGK